MATPTQKLKDRFRGFLPVVVDVETGGFNAATDALLELAAIPLQMSSGKLSGSGAVHFHIAPFEGANLEPAALEFTGIDVHHPFRAAVTEAAALDELFDTLNKCLKDTGCTRCVLVGHNAWFDLSFINAATQRCNIKRSPFHTFTSFDTATLAGVAYGQTVLVRACEKAGIDFDINQAHSALYDTQKTTELFCKIVNQYHSSESSG